MSSSQRGKSTMGSKASAHVSQPGFANGHRALVSLNSYFLSNGAVSCSLQLALR